MMENRIHQPSQHQEMNLIKHDIRNHLSALKLNLYLLQKQGHPEQLDALSKMKEELGEINELLEDIHD